MPEDERVVGKARLNVPGSSAEPVGDLFRDRGSPRLVPVGELAELARRPPRSTDTKDLSASLRSDGRCGGVGRVLNLCDGGMLLEISSDLELAETVGFELVGPGFRYAGRAAVAHRQDGAIGLRFLTWNGPVERPVGVLVAARLRGQQLGLHDPGKLGIGPRMMWDSRGGDDRAAVSGLSALIEQSPGAATRRHQVLNVSEQGMLIDGLALAPDFVRARWQGHQPCRLWSRRAVDGVERRGCSRSLAWRAGSDPWSRCWRERASWRLVDAYITDWW
jgi:hypothetical protein